MAAGNGDITVKVNGVSAPPTEIHRLMPDRQMGQIQRLEIRLEQLRAWQDKSLRKTFLQYDRLIEKPGCPPDVMLKSIEAKSRCIAAIAESTSRLSMTLERERRAREEQLKAMGKSRQSAIQLMRINQKAMKLSAGDVMPLQSPQPRVRMFAIGCDFKATVGLDRIERKAPMAEPEPP